MSDSPTKKSGTGPEPIPYIPEGIGYAEVVAPCAGKVISIKELPKSYKGYEGVGVGFKPNTDNMKVFMAGDIVRKDLYENIYVIQNPTFHCSTFFQTGVYMDESKGKNSYPDDYLPSGESLDFPKRVNKGEDLCVVDNQKLMDRGKGNICVIVAQLALLKENNQDIVLADGIEGKWVKAGDLLFTFVKKKS